MTYPLAGVREKIERGTDHLEELERLVPDFIGPDVYALAVEFDPQENCFVTRFAVKRDAPLKFGIVVGEAIQQYRSALDHLGLQLARLKRPGVESANFPIYTSKAVYTTPTGKNNRSPQAISRQFFRPAEVARIERMQPYQQAEPRKAGLAILQRLSNIDKHAVIHTPFGRLTELRISTPNPNTGIEIVRAGLSTTAKLEDGAELARWRFIGEGDVKVEFAMNVGLAYGDEGFAFGLIKELGIGVIRIVDEFEGAIPELRPT